MKLLTAILLMATTFFQAHAQDQATSQLPPDSIQMKPLRGPIVTWASLLRKDSIFIVCFWSVNSESGIQELNAINARYEKWKQSTPFHLLAISCDAGNLQNRVRPTANMNGWTFDVYSDLNGDLQETFHIRNLPESLVLLNGKVIYQQAGYQSGAESYLFEKVMQSIPRKR